MFIFVLLSRSLTILSSCSSSSMFSRMSSNWVQLVVSNAADISIPLMSTFSSCVIEHFAATHRWDHTTSAVLLSGFNPLCPDDMYFVTTGHILCRHISESVFLMVFNSVRGLKIFTGPLGLPGFGGVIIPPSFIFIFSCVSNRLLRQLAVSCASSGMLYL